MLNKSFFFFFPQYLICLLRHAWLAIYTVKPPIDIQYKYLVPLEFSIFLKLFSIELNDS